MGDSVLRSWEDADSPTLIPTAGSFISLLQEVLVNGYGAFPGMGWTLAYSGTNVAVFRNEGTKTFIRFDHNTERHRVRVTAYESMFDVDNGIAPCPLTHEYYIYLSAEATSAANIVPWRILGDNQGIWILINSSYAIQGGANHYLAASFRSHYIGDYIPYDFTNIIYNFCMFRGDPTYDTDPQYEEWLCSEFKIVRAEYSIMRNAIGEMGAVNVGISSGSAFELIALGQSADICDRTSIVQLTSIPTIHSVSGFIGRLPGFKNSLSAYGDRKTQLTSHADVLVFKPEMVFDSGDYKEHFMRCGSYSSNYKQPRYIVLTEGKGFRYAA